jgi:small subunit ribosomal protein S8
LKVGAEMMTDPIADLLTRIRNGVQVERPFVDIPSSRLKVSIVEALQREGFVWDYELIEGGPCQTLRVNLKYGPNGEHVIQHIERISKPGCRVYCAVDDMKEVRQGTGISVLSTSKGVLSNREARKQGVGGELVCQVW